MLKKEKQPIFHNTLLFERIKRPPRFVSSTILAKDSEETSLNKCLYTRPCLLTAVTETVAIFRLFPMTLSSDIKKAFLMIAVCPSDRDALRFLWVDDVQSETPEIITYARVVFGVSCSPFLLNATLKEHLHSYSERNPKVCTKLVNSLYAENVNTGTYTVEEATKLYESSKEMRKERKI